MSAKTFPPITPTDSDSPVWINNPQCVPAHANTVVIGRWGTAQARALYVNGTWMLLDNWHTTQAPDAWRSAAVCEWKPGSREKANPTITVFSPAPMHWKNHSRPANPSRWLSRRSLYPFEGIVHHGTYGVCGMFTQVTL